jgi:transcriptional regulator with XRE-family HTH domain
MYGNAQRLSSPEVQERRRDGGKWLRELREARGLSQRQFAELTGSEYYTFISQLETGRGRIPPDKYRLWAEVLGIDAKLFVRKLMSYYDPVTHDILFGDQSNAA